jgi:two-component system CheB/CheR fusion protein
LTDTVPAPLTVVALGASAGGLEAFERFFAALPAHSDMAFVVVQHLDPHHASLLPEILQRSTPLPVVQATDQMPLAAGRIHVGPPNHVMGLLNGLLQLQPLPAGPGPHLSIDAFFRALALDQGERAVAIVLSGTGSDGTLGLRAVADAGGRCLIQDPATAGYGGMPRSAIDSGVAAQVLSVADMPAELLKHPSDPGQAPAAVAATQADDAAPLLVGTPSDLQRILTQLRMLTGHDFSGYKRSTIARRVARRMAAVGVADPAAYAARLQEQPAEAQALFHELLINVTRFFRDPQSFEALKTDVLPALLQALGPQRVIRVWVPGCATGEEAYSVAMLLREAMDEGTPAFRAQIYATDLDEEAIAVARVGRYPKAIAADLSPQRLTRFFSDDETGWRVKKDVREMVVFAVQSVIKDPPFTRLDLVSCRNLMIYLEPALQDRLVRTFHYALKPGGVLVLSPSEGVGEHAELFEPVDRKWKFYRARPSVPAARTVFAEGVSWSPEGPRSAAPEALRKPRETQLAELARRSLLQAFAPAAVVTNRQGQVLYVHGETGAYLRPAPGLPNHDVVDMAVQGLQGPLREALQEVVQGEQALATRTVTLVQPSGMHATLNVAVRQLPSPDGEAAPLLVSFQPIESTPPQHGAPRGHAASVEMQRLAQAERELAAAKQSVEVIREEHQSAIVELKSTNEELQSANEELQSANEELETSREELQSLNEELATVNAELQSKLDQMSDMQDDMKNLLDSIRLGIVFLDAQLRIRRFTRDATLIYRLQGTDIGRSLADIRSELQGEDDLLGEAQRVLDSLVPVEREVATAPGQRYLARIQPYRTVDNVIDGVVLTFADVTERERAREAAARGARVLAQSIVEVVPTPLLVLDAQMNLVTANQACFSTFGGTLQEAAGRSLFELGGGAWDTPAVREALQASAAAHTPLTAWPATLPGSASQEPRKVWLSVRRMRQSEVGADLVLLVADPVEPARAGGAGGAG